MPRIKQETVYTFDELSDSAKERARQWWREAAGHDEWWDCTFEDAKQCLEVAGFRISNIYFSGFSSQGDGACFEGTWSAHDTKPVKAMKQHAPKDKELHRIAAEMRALAKAHKGASMSVKQRGHYSHEFCTEFSVDFGDEECNGNAEAMTAAEESIIETSRDAMRWIYRQLEKEYDYQNSDEVVDDTIRANEYEFDEDGRRA